MHDGLWTVLNTITLKTALYQPISFEEVFDTISASQFTNNLMELMYKWPEAQPNQSSGASRITSLENFQFNFERWRYIKEFNQLMGARWFVQSDLRQGKQFFRGNLSTNDFERSMLKIQVAVYDEPEYLEQRAEYK